MIAQAYSITVGDGGTGATACNGDFAIGTWWKVVSSLTSRHGIIACYDDGLFSGWEWCYENGEIIFWSNFGGIVKLSWTPTLNTWYFLLVSRVGSTIRFFANGVVIDTLTDQDFSSDGDSLSIGSFNNAGANSLDGYMTDTAIWKGLGRSTTFTTPSEPLTSSSLPSDW